MSDYPMLISNKLHSFRNFSLQNYDNSARNKHQISQFYKSQSISEHHWHELILLS